MKHSQEPIDMHAARQRSANPVLHPLFYLVVLPASLFFAFAAWSPPLFYSTVPEWFDSWQKALFSQVCHQQPDRTLYIRDVPLAVCSRCTGIYTALLAALATLSFFFTFVIKVKLYIMRMFVMASLILVLDGASNLFQVWQTPDFIRLLTGAFWGFATGALLIFSLVVPRKRKRGDNLYGTCST